MRRSSRFRAAPAIAIACAIVGLAGCSSSGSSGAGSSSSSAPVSDAPAAESSEAGPSAEASESAQSYTVGFSNPTAAQPILQNFQNSLTEAGKHMGIEVKSLDAQLDANKQVTDINQFVAEGVDAIIVFPLAQDSLTPALNKAREAGIKVIGYNAILEPTEGDIAPYDANFDQGEDIEGAQLLSDYVAEQVGGKGNVLGIGLGFPVPALQFMMSNYEKFVTAKSPDIKWLDTVENPTDDIAGGETVVADAITKAKGDIQAVMAYNTSSALGAAVAFKNASLPAPVIVGQNGDPASVQAINDGTMSATVDIVPWREALVGITLTKMVLDGAEYPKWVATPVEMYTKENIDQRLDWDEALAQITAGTLSCASGAGCPPELSTP